MNWLYIIGLVLHILIVDCKNNQGCIVDDVYKKVFWSGDVVNFFAYVLEDGIVTIEITYEGLAEEDFTTLYISPSAKFSKIMEAKNGKHDYFNLTNMKMANNWVEFNISSKTGPIDLMYEPDTHEQIPIRQNSKTFKDLIIKGSNISLCKEERKWKVFEKRNTAIPLGRDAGLKPFHIKFDPLDDIRPVLKCYNYSKHLIPIEYELSIESNKVTLKSLKKEFLEIFYVSQNVTTIDIFSEAEDFTVSIVFGAKPISLPIITSEEKICPTCYDTLYQSTLIPPLVIFIIATIVVGIGFKFDVLYSRIWKNTFSASNKETPPREGNGSIGNNSHEDQAEPMMNNENRPETPPV